MSKQLYLVLAAVLLALTMAPRGFAKRVIADRIVARINSDIITQIQYQHELAKLRAQLSGQYQGPDLDAQVREESKNLLRDLVDQDLMVQKAKDDDINVETDVVKQLDEIRAQQHLADQVALQKAVEAQGLVWEDFVDNIRRNFLMREVIGREVGSRITITTADARKYFEAHKQEFATTAPQVRLAEIIIANDKHKPEEVKQRADAALAEIKAGERWENVAKKYSDGDTAAQGGDIGIFKEGTLLPTLNDTIKNLDVNDTSPLIETKYGPMIIKLLARQSAGIPKFEEVQQRVMNRMYDAQIQVNMRKYLATLRKQSYIFIAPGYVDTGGEHLTDAVLSQNEKQEDVSSPTQ